MATVRHTDAAWAAPDPSQLAVRLDKLLVAAGLAPSGTEANRLIKQGAVRIENEVQSANHILIDALPARLSVRVGKRAKLVVITE